MYTCHLNVVHWAKSQPPAWFFGCNLPGSLWPHRPGTYWNLPQGLVTCCHHPRTPSWSSAWLALLLQALPQWCSLHSPVEVCPFSDFYWRGVWMCGWACVCGHKCMFTWRSEVNLSDYFSAVSASFFFWGMFLADLKLQSWQGQQVMGIHLSPLPQPWDYSGSHHSSLPLMDLGPNSEPHACKASTSFTDQSTNPHSILTWQVRKPDVSEQCWEWAMGLRLEFPGFLY